MSDEARYEARWDQHLARRSEDAATMRNVRVIEDADGNTCANLGDLVEAVEVAASESTLSVATALRELAHALRGLRDG